MTTAVLDRHRIDILGPEGHTSITWDVKNEAEVEEARQEFERLKEAGYLLFEVTEEQTDVFRPSAGRIDAKLIAGPAPVAAKVPDPTYGAPKLRGREPRAPKAAEQTREFKPETKRTVAVRRMHGG